MVQVAQELGVSDYSLYKWRKQGRSDGELAFPGNGKVALTAEQRENVRLKKELEPSLKSDPNEAEVLQCVYPTVKPGYHLNKRHWNTVTLDGTVDDEVALEWLDRSYERVVAGLTRQDREALAA